MRIPPGFHTLTPYLFVEGADRFIAFLVDGLGAEEVHRTVHEGRIANAHVRVGDTSFMLSEATDGFPALPASHYLYVEDADASMARAVGAGATELMPAMDMDYGDRQGGVRDAWGNLWWISQRLVDGPYEA